jgi:predicted ATPase/DNA-binding CsgD family transcriptional regulator
VSDPIGSSAENLDRLVGRDRELAAITDRLQTARLVSLTGPGGSGKTRLAEAVVARARAEAREAWFVDASALTDAALIPATIATILKVESNAADPPLDAVRDALGEGEVLIALDNLEQIDRVGQAVFDLLASVPRLRVLATTRSRLDVRGEVEIAVPSLDLPGSTDVGGVESSAAGALFLERARAGGRLRLIDDATAADIAALLGRLDGLPLAIELAAARTRILSPREVIARLDSHGISAIDSSTGDARRSLSQIIDWTRHLLDRGQAEVLEAVSVCAGFDLAMAEAMAPGTDVLGSVDELISLGLVRNIGQIQGSTRFRLLETVRTHVLSTLTSEAKERYRDRHAEGVLAVVEEQLGRDDGRTPEARERLDADADNIRLALDRFDHTDPARGLHLWNLIFYPFWATRARVREGMARFERTADLVVEPTIELSRATVRYAMNLAWVAEEAAVRQSMTRALELAQLVGDHTSEVETLAALGAVAINEGDSDLAGRVNAGLDQIDAAALSLDLQMRVAEARQHTAAVLHGIASTEALTHGTEAIRLAQAARLPRTEVALQGNLAIAHLHRRGYEDAAAASERAVDLARQLGSPLLPWALSLMSMALAEAGHVHRAVEALTETIEETVDRDLPVQTGDTLLAAMPVALAAGYPLLAARLWGAATALERSGATDIPPDDRELAERTLERVRRHESAVKVELAIRDGAASEALELLESVPQLIAAMAPSAISAPVLRHAELTRREIEILDLVGQGKSDAQIAAELFISPKTASVHVSNAKAKLGVNTRLEAALWARERGLVDMEPHNS